MTALANLTDFVLASHQWHNYGPWFAIFPLLFFGLWVALFVIVGRRWRHPHCHSGESLLAERYARGEIDESEYRERRTVLRQKG